MYKQSLKNLATRELNIGRPFEVEQAVDILSQLAVTTPRGAVIWEIHSHEGRVQHRICADSNNISKIEHIIKTYGDIHLTPIANSNYDSIDTVRQLTVSGTNLSLNQDAIPAAILAGLSAFASVHSGEMVMQIILGKSIAPHTTPKNVLSPNASLLEVIALGNVEASQEMRKSIKEKNEQPCFEACIRISVSNRRLDRINSLFSSLRTLESAGVHFSLTPVDPELLKQMVLPKKFNVKLSVSELPAFMLLPFGEDDLPGIDGMHPKHISPPEWYQEPTGKKHDRTFAVSRNHSDGKHLSFADKDMLMHCCIVGGTGVGKSTLMLRQILADAEANKSLLILDPKNDLIRDILERLPDHRLKDVVIINAADPCSVGFNPLNLPGEPELIADSILAVFRQLFPDNMGIRSVDILSASLLTLLQTDGSNLLWLPTLLTNENFRHKIVEGLTDEVVLKPFWRQYDAMRDSERKQEIAPALNKMRQLLYRPGLRSILGQSNPKFQLTDLLYKRKIVLVPLNKGIIGAESARLLGSLIVGLTWMLALSRANIPPEKRHIVSMYIDELQDYIALPTDLSDALAQARGLGVAITMAHQYRGQLPPDIRAGIDANARNKICFTLDASDAKDMAAQAPELTAEDFMTLPKYEIYTRFMSGGKSTGWIRGVTLPPPDVIRDSSEISSLNQRNYGMKREAVDRVFLDYLKNFDIETPPELSDTVFGGRRKP